MVLRQGSTMLAIGLTLGVGAGLLLSRQLTQLLFQVAPDDPAVVVGTLGVLGLTGLVACLVPARRASSLDPLAALRRD
jgi:ABC-type antimicrobial peptide transport system permease subunit